MDCLCMKSVKVITPRPRPPMDDWLTHTDTSNLKYLSTFAEEDQEFRGITEEVFAESLSEPCLDELFQTTYWKKLESDKRQEILDIIVLNKKQEVLNELHRQRYLTKTLDDKKRLLQSDRNKMMKDLKQFQKKYAYVKNLRLSINPNEKMCSYEHDENNQWYSLLHAKHILPKKMLQTDCKDNRDRILRLAGFQKVKVYQAIRDIEQRATKYRDQLREIEKLQLTVAEKSKIETKCMKSGDSRGGSEKFKITLDQRMRRLRETRSEIKPSSLPEQARRNRVQFQTKETSV